MKPRRVIGFVIATAGVLLGAFLTVAAKLQGEDREQALMLWKRKGME